MTNLQIALTMYSKKITVQNEDLLKKVVKLNALSETEALSVMNLLDDIRDECDYMESLLHKHTALSEHFRKGKNDNI